jgi:uncharacterized protein YdhG (YjbR/CyaY superfamily)
MSPVMETYTSIDQCIQTFPKEVQVLLEKVRKTIHEAAPDATEAIAYGIPTFKLNGNLVHFCGYKHHIGFYPAPSGIKKFQSELAQYESGKGSLKFPIDKPIPYDLITKVVKFRVKENTAKKK